MYSQQGGRPGAGAPKMQNRYMKGRLPEGVDFAAYPGRSSTPLPTAESKSAERINQLKIWNEAATNDEKRRLNAAKGIGPGAQNPSSARRTDSFKDAKDRHSASFHGTPPPVSAHLAADDPDHVVADPIAHPPSYHRTAMGSVGLPTHRSNDMFADRSDTESEDEQEDANDSPLPEPLQDAADRFAAGQPLKPLDQNKPAAPAQPANSAALPVLSPPEPQTRITNHNHIHNNNKSQSAAHSGPRTERKQRRSCCTIM